MRGMIREILIGSGLALLVFLALQRIDITPIVLLLVILGLLRFLADGRGLGGRKFEVVGGGTSAASVATVSFADIGGQEVAKREFMEALDFIKNAEKVSRLGIRPLKGILLSGPPGTGKTLMAKAAAGYTDSVFTAASGSQFVEMYAGVGAQRVRKLFRDAREAARRQNKLSAIIFIDEIEVLGGRRGQHTSHLEYDQTLNELLVQMDGISTGPDGVRILVVAATNRPDLLDPALLRPGRFDRVVSVDLPDKEGRLHILKIHAAGKPIAPEVELEDIARDTFGFSGAHLESLINEAAIQAMRAGDTLIRPAHFREAIDKVMMGEKLDRKPRDVERRRVACHEAGHAIVSELVRPGSVSAITVTSRGRALGYMRQSAEDDQYLYTAEDLSGQIAVCLGGAVAEELVCGDRSTGSQGDFEQAAQIAERMVLAGMSSLGVVHGAKLSADVLHRAVQEVIHGQEERVRQALAGCRTLLEELSDELLQEEKMSGQELRRRLADRRAVPFPPAERSGQLERSA